MQEIGWSGVESPAKGGRRELTRQKAQRGIDPVQPQDKSHGPKCAGVREKAAEGPGATARLPERTAPGSTFSASPAERGAHCHTKTRLAAYRRPMVRASCSWSWCFHASSQRRRAIISAIVRYGDPRLLAAGTGNRCQHDGYLRPRCYGYSFC